ncbi:MAG: exodeoxyribonuclease VII small subunit [Chloroflexi bacterium]|nr:exodeoxyribonuclease VII small subunit [Chloroflexota bacterium]
MKDKKPTPKQDIQALSYEQAFEELEMILRQLENEHASLEETLALFERGKELVNRCTALLDAADLRLHILSENSDEIETGGEN